MKSHRPSFRSTSLFFRNRLARARQKPRLLKLRLLKDVYKDYRALGVPKTGFWSRLALQRSTSAGMSLQTSSSTAWSSAGNRDDKIQSASASSTSSSSLLPLQDELQPAVPQSRRQRLLGLARATRDTYIPKLTSVAQLATSGTQKSSQVEYDEFGLPISFPNGTMLTLFPSFTKPVTAADSQSNQDGYLVSVRGWMWCPGIMSRKNRLVLSLAKQLTKGGASGNEIQNRAIEKILQDSESSLDADTYDIESLSSASIESPYSDSSYVDKTIKERLSSFIATSIAKASLSIVIGSEDYSFADHLVQVSLFTDGRGHFEQEIFVPYKPSIVKVTASTDNSVYGFQEVTIVCPSGFGIISDIDDTVKHTGVIGDKRELMHRLLTGHINSWNIPAVVEWYQELMSIPSATFHYVSNSPWQLYSVIHQYFEAVKLPPGSIHLKQYSGNIIGSLREPSSSRKRKTLVKILEDYPQKKFICIGDSGEHDFEAYVDLARSYPNRIMAIYIRAIPGSFSSLPDLEILTKIKWMTSDWKQRRLLKKMKKDTLIREENAIENLIDMDLNVDSSEALARALKLPPLIPRKPDSLKGQRLDKLVEQTPPPVPARRRNAFDPERSFNRTGRPESTKIYAKSREQSPEGKPPALPRRKEPNNRSPEPRNNAFDNLQTLYGVNDEFELEEVDEKGALWIQKVNIALHELNNTETDVAFFEDEDEDFFKATLEGLQSKVENGANVY